MKLIQISTKKYINKKSIDYLCDNGDADFTLIVNGAEMHVATAYAEHVRMELDLGELNSETLVTVAYLAVIKNFRQWWQQNSKDVFPYEIASAICKFPKEQFAPAVFFHVPIPVSEELYHKSDDLVKRHVIVMKETGYQFRTEKSTSGYWHHIENSEINVNYEDCGTESDTNYR